MKRIAVIISLVCAVSFVLAVCAVQGFHFWRMRHFVGHGPHIDVVVGNSDIGRRDMYYARYWNVSAHSVYIEGCRLPGGYAGEGIMFRWDVQRWNSTTLRWDSLRGADHWVPTPFGGYGNEEKCLAELTRIPPLGSRVLGWVYKDWVTTREPVRMAIHTSLALPPSQQQILYTTAFVVDRCRALPPVVKE
jgi:hypothetical protein